MLIIFAWKGINGTRESISKVVRQMNERIDKGPFSLIR